MAALADAPRREKPSICVSSRGLLRDVRPSPRFMGMSGTGTVLTKAELADLWGKLTFDRPRLKARFDPEENLERSYHDHAKEDWLPTAMPTRKSALPSVG